MFKNLVFCLSWVAILVGALPAGAQVRPLEHLYEGYPATVLQSKKDVETIFDQMPLVFRPHTWLSSGSQCFHRAEVWTYDFYRNQNLYAMKVFVFYTHAYKVAYQAMYGKKFEWWFHVAPYLLATDPLTQTPHEYVVDPTFADTVLDMAPWGTLFVDTKKKCKEWVPYADFRAEVENGADAVVGSEHCYLVRVPAVDFDPREVEAREAGAKTGYTWDLNNVSIAIDNAVIPSRKGAIRARLGL